jgi:esterase/lipase superfamily enzyme
MRFWTSATWTAGTARSWDRRCRSCPTDTWGYPLLLFPTAAADYLEDERFGLIGAISHQIAAGRVRVFSINSINQQA